MTGRTEATASHPVLAANRGGRVMLVQKETIRNTCELFARHGCRGEEAVAYWYGIECADGRISAVLSVAAPPAECSRGSYAVGRSEMARMGRAMRSQSMVSLAQFHTHPGRDTEHSQYDDLNAISARDGFLSLVAPWYGRGLDAALEGVTVHEAWNGRWHMLEGDAHRERIAVVDAVKAWGGDA